jgi:hypothetical protein
MTSLPLTVATILCLLACESPAEKQGAALLEKAKVLRSNGDTEEAYVALIKVKNNYPTTKAAMEAEKITQKIIEEQQKELEKAAVRVKLISEKIKLSNKLLDSLFKTTDDMEQINWYYDKRAKNWILNKYFKLYFGIAGNPDEPHLLPLRLQVQFTGDTWIFAESIMIKVGEKVYTFKPNNWEHDNSSGSVWEKCDEPISNLDPVLLEAIVNAEEVKIRFDGSKSYSDFTLPKAQLAAVKNVYNIWKTIHDAGEVNK